MKKLSFILPFLFFVPIFATAETSAETHFSKGNTAFVAATSAKDENSARASYTEASREYTAAIEAGDVSWAAYFNLGNACYKLGDFGNAVLDYERAFAIDPVKPETEINLAKARQASGLEPVRAESRLEKWGTKFPMRGLLWTGAVGGWVFLAAFLLPFLYGRHKLATITASVASFALFAACAVGMYGWHIHAKWRIVKTETPMLAAPDEKASEIRKLGPATSVIPTRTFDKWTFVRTEQGDEGWVLSDAAASVWTE